MKKHLFILLSLLPCTVMSATFDTWSTNENTSGSYIVTISEQATDGFFDFHVTVDPWDAEVLGLFVDFGNYDLLGPTPLSNVTPAGEVSLFASDTSSDNCGAGCNLQGLSPTLLTPDDEWELVFRLGAQGFDNIQTFSWTISGLTGLDESDIGVLGIRAQQQCAPGDTLPNGSCGGSDKSYFSSSSSSSSSSGTASSTSGFGVPEPSTYSLLGLAAVAFGFVHRRRQQKV